MEWWDHPDWYDLHDTAWTAGSEREPEHYRELMLSLPPLDQADHLIDVGAGTGKLAFLIARSYPSLGSVTLIEPNHRKLQRAGVRVREILPDARIQTLAALLGESEELPQNTGSFVTSGSVLMPTMELRGGKLAEGLEWLRKSLVDIRNLLQPGGWAYLLENLAAPWARGGPNDPVRRLNMQEYVSEIERAQFVSIECTYRFRDRVVVRGQRAE